MPPTPRFLPALLLAFACACAVLSPAPLLSSLHAAASAPAPAPRPFDVPAGTAADTLKKFSEQAGVAVVFATDSSGAAKTNAVKGTYTAVDAISLLLRDTGLKATASEKTGTLTITRDALPNAPRAAAAPSPARPEKTPAASPASASTDTVVLSPFEVVSAKDYGYTATNTLAGGRLNTALRDTPASISVLTREFLDDIGGGDFRSALQYATNAVPVGDTDTPLTTGIGTTRAGGAQAENNPTGVTVRGFAEARATRNFFVWNLASDNYNTERIDISRGPNTLIFGDAGSGGVANVTTKQARFRPFQNVTVRTTSYGGARAMLDVNRPLGDTLAVRVNAISSRERGWRDVESYQRQGAALAATWQPRPATQLRLDVEWGRTKNYVPQNVVRDYISAWDGAFTFSQPGLTPTATSGAVRFDTATRPDYLVYTAGSESLGLVNWRGFGRTNGNDASLETGRLSPVAPAGSTPLVLTNDARATLGRRYFGVLPDRGFNLMPSNRANTTKFGAFSAVLDHRIGENLFFDVGYARQQDHRDQNITGQPNFVFLDINAVLPSGAANPNFLRPFVDFINNRDDHFFSTYNEARVSGVWQVRRPWFEQKLGFFASHRWTEGGQRQFIARRVNNPTTPAVTNANNVPVFRTYLDRRNSPVPFLTLEGDFNGVRIARVESNGGDRTEGENDTLQFYATGSWLESRRLKTVVGVRRDVAKTSGRDPVTDPVTNILVGYVSGSSRSTAQTSPTAGAVFDVFPWLSAYANYSESFLAASGGAVKLDGSVSEPRRGAGREVGVKFELFSGRVSGSAGYYDQNEENNIVRVIALNNSDIVGLNTTAAGVNLNAIATALNRAIFPLNRTALPNYNDTQNVHATGFEFDATANLTRGWSLLANVALPRIEQSDALADTRAFVAANRAAWLAAATAAGPATLATVTSRLAALDDQFGQFPDGRKSNGVLDYTANLFTRYRFVSGPLEGLSVGGGVNLRGRRISGVQPNGGVIYSSGYPLLNAMLGYSGKIRGRSVSVQANISNLLDQTYQRYSAYYTVNGALQPYIYTQLAPRRLVLSATVGF